MAIDIRGTVTYGPSIDTDALTYINAVQIADGATLEDGVRLAINNFVVGCKADGIWTAIKSSCILAGARTLNGALVPLVGTAPTNVNFISGDYNRKTGLVGDGTTKYLDSNRNNNADPQNSKHLSVYFGATLSSSTARVHLGVVGVSFAHVGASVIATDTTTDAGRYRSNGATAAIISSGLSVGLKAVNRNISSQIITRQNQANDTTASTSETPISANYFVFARNAVASGGAVDSFSNARLSFYSIGESLDLQLLDARVTTLINSYATAIP
jgi:hypothetical protein